MENEDRLKAMINTFNGDTRLFVLECSTYIEYKISDTLGRLLEIDWKDSTSLGYGRMSLGFNQKAHLINDLQQENVKLSGKLNVFMKIRNKFAHIQEINSFKNYFSIIKSSNEDENQIKRLYPYLNYDNDNIEDLYKFIYFQLTLDIFKELFDLDIANAYNQGLEIGQNQGKNKIIEALKQELIKTDSGKAIWNQAFKQLEKEKQV